MEKAPLPNIPGYKIKRQLGQGGMARVFLAKQESFGRDVALKVMHAPPGNDNIWAKRFIHEAQVIAQLSHPNIVPVYDVGTHDGQFYISMEFVKGGSLEDLKLGSMPINKTLKVIAGVAAGLDFAGEKGFVHRDVKPDNVMFREDGSPVILDFGIVKQLDSTDSKMTQTGTVVGTATYMSPEQAQGRSLDIRSDIYSLGIMFYELLTGAPPFQGDSAIATLMMHVNDKAQPLPQTLRPLQCVMDKVLAKNPGERYPRARAMIEHLQKLEPQLKQIISRQQATLVTNPNDVTVAHPTGGEVTIQSGSHPTAEISESELTQVLSSAKATIKDFSEEARAKRAKRTRRAMTAISIAAICSLAYLGYQQLYLVPIERAAAEEKVRLAQEQSQEKITRLLKRADGEITQVVLSDSNSVNKLIAIYREVLKLDPENRAANDALEKLGSTFIEKTFTSLSLEKLEQAEMFYGYARQLVPTHNKLSVLQQRFQSARADRIDTQLQREKISTLLDLAAEDIRVAEGFSESAYAKLKQVLRIDPGNTQARGTTELILKQLYSDAKQQISANQLKLAGENLKILQKYYPEKEKVSQLLTHYQKQKNQFASEQSQQSLSKKASRLLRERRTISINDELREIYLAMLKISPRSREAKTGLNETSRFDIEIALTAIEERDFSRAQQQLKLVEKYTPNYSQLKEVKSKLNASRKAVNDADKLLASTTTLLQSTSTGNQLRQDLLRIYNNIEQARNLDPGNAGLAPALSQLENKYMRTMSKLIANDDKDLLAAYFEDTLEKTWPSDRILNLQIARKSADKEKEKAKKKRIVSGGF